MSLPQSSHAGIYPQPGEVIDFKYRVDRLVGEGGMGAVARATHLYRKAPVALKFMSPAALAVPGAVPRFMNEGVAASQIDSDNVVKVYDVGQLSNGTPYLVMEYLDGLDLGQLLRRCPDERVDVPRAVHFALQALRALQAAHTAGVIHRDIKPSNCFVIEKDGEPDFLKLVDFGISKVVAGDGGDAPNLTLTNSALGTPLYMAPEQARSPRDVDYRADLYSLGAIVYQLLSGRPPYTAPSGQFAELLYKMITSLPDPLQTLRPEVPEGLAAAVHRSLTHDPTHRFASALDMAEALIPFADERSAQIITRLRAARRSLLPPSSRAPEGVGALSPIAALAGSVVPAGSVGEMAAASPAGAASSVGRSPEAAPAGLAHAGYDAAARAPTVPPVGSAVATNAGSEAISAPNALPRERTQVGLARDARSTQGAGGARAAVTAGLGVIVLASLGVMGFAVLRRPDRDTTHDPVTGTPAAEPAKTAGDDPPRASVAPPPPTVAAALPSVATAEPAPDASAAPSSSAEDKVPAASASHPSKTPSTLGGIQLH